MKKLAILGATSHIAGDFILEAARSGYDLYLFSRRPADLRAQLEGHGIENGNCADYLAFPAGEYDAIVNFVGVGDPARAAAMGSSIFDVTLEYDFLATAYVKRKSDTRYIFLSSGAVYGPTFLEPASASTLSQIPINSLNDQNYYSVAKLYAESRHRALEPLPIVDIRVFNYFSRTVDMTARFFITDVLRAIRDGKELETGSSTMHRDYQTAADFFRLIDSVLNAPPANAALDAYSRSPVEKFELLDAMRQEFGLRYSISSTPPVMIATGAKPAYYSTNHAAESFGYRPRFTSLECVITESRAILGR